MDVLKQISRHAELLNLFLS